jgi:hypothetical protein
VIKLFPVIEKLFAIVKVGKINKRESFHMFFGEGRNEN